MSRLWSQAQAPDEVQRRRLGYASMAACGCSPTTASSAGQLADRSWMPAAFLREGDALAVIKLDRIGRSVGNQIGVACGLHKRGANLIVLYQATDTTTPTGLMLFHVLAPIAEFTVFSTFCEGAEVPSRGRCSQGFSILGALALWVTECSYRVVRQVEKGQCR